MKYKELENLDDYSCAVYAHDIRDMGVKTTATTHKRHVRSASIWDDSDNEFDAYYLDDVLDDIYNAGWEYKSTYWKGGSMGSAHPVLCFIHPDPKNK